MTGADSNGIDAVVGCISGLSFEISVNRFYYIWYFLSQMAAVSTLERKYIGGRSKNASRTDARRAAADARPRPGRVTPSSAFQVDQ
jgi:hypothetical protein